MGDESENNDGKKTDIRTDWKPPFFQRSLKLRLAKASPCGIQGCATDAERSIEKKTEREKTEKSSIGLSQSTERERESGGG